MVNILVAFGVFVIGFSLGYFVAKSVYNVRIIITRIRKW